MAGSDLEVIELLLAVVVENVSPMAIDDNALRTSSGAAVVFSADDDARLVAR